MIRKLLVPVDFSPASREALDYAAALARTVKSELVVLHVVETVQYATPADLFGAAANLGMLEQEQRRLAQRELGRVETQLRKKRLKVRTVLGTGTAARVIVSVAKRLKASLIVMATHGRTGLSHLLMGSVAERVVRIAECPVLTLRPKRTRKRAPARRRKAAARKRPATKSGSRP